MMICVLSFPDNAERKRGREGERGRVSESQRERERDACRKKSWEWRKTANGDLKTVRRRGKGHRRRPLFNSPPFL